MQKKIIRKLLKKDDPTILEVGTYYGNDPKEFLEEFSNIKIYCFEPNPICIEKHKNKINDERCKFYEVAISDEDNLVEFYQSSGQDSRGKPYDGSSSLKKPKEHLTAYPLCKFDNKMIVKAVKLDTWIQENRISEIDFIWADVQGAEEKLINGGFKALSITKYFYTEFYDNEMYEGQHTLNDLKRLLPSFRIVCLYGKNVLFKNIKLSDSTIDLIRDRILLNFHIFSKERDHFRLPFKTGLRRALSKIK